MASKQGYSIGQPFWIEARRLYCQIISIGYDGRGKLKRVPVCARNKEDLGRKVQERIVALAQSKQDVEDPTLASYLLQWLASASRGRIRPTTAKRYQSLVRIHVEPHIGCEQLRGLRSTHLMRLFQDLRGGGASESTLRQVYAVLHRALDRATRGGLIPTNPCRGVDPPKPVSKRQRALTSDEVSRLLEAAQGDRYFALVLIAVTLGCRIGELFALQWDWLDLPALGYGNMWIRGTLVEIDGKPSVGQTKTPKGTRRIPLPRMIVDELIAHRDKLAQLGIDGAWVFCDTKGGPLRYQNFVKRHFLPVLTQAGISKVTFHVLRHTEASRMVQVGMPLRQIQEILGHSSYQVTMDVYSHMLPDMELEAAKTLERIVDISVFDKVDTRLDEPPAPVSILGLSEEPGDPVADRP